jgi:hypothetical protein
MREQRFVALPGSEQSTIHSDLVSTLHSEGIPAVMRRHKQEVRSLNSVTLTISASKIIAIKRIQKSKGVVALAVKPPISVLNICESYLNCH